MLRTGFLLPALLLASGAFSQIFPFSNVEKKSTLPVVSNQFVVEVRSASDIPTKRSLSPRDELYASLNARAVGYQVDKEFDSEIFTGAVLTLSDAEGIQELENSPGIVSIKPVVKYDRPVPVKWEPLAADDTPDSQSTHVMTGVDKLHAEGIFGAGIKVGIIDSGIDYTHPALGGGFGPGFKVIGGYDLVGDDYTGDNEPVPDDDPLDLCGGHGTHVAGIIGADPNNPFGISGVAPEASLLAYRLFGCNGFVTDPVIIDALIRAYDDGSDVITLSLGGADGWTTGAASVVASRIATTGRIVTIAAGNSGSSGSWFTSGPANGIDVISVASVDNIAIALQNATVGGAEHNPITYFETFPLPFTQTFPIYAISNDTTVVDDACSALPDSTPDLSGYLTIVRRGSCTFVQKLANVVAKGANVVLIYDNGTGFNSISVGQYNATLIQAADGEWLVQQFVAGVPVTITFPQSGGSYDYPDPSGGLVSEFTSYGPSNDFYVKPAISAPGGNILSTLPTNMGSYGVASGTSMATPFVAGSAALLLSVKGKSRNVGRTARTLFETTSVPVGSTHVEGDPLQTVTQQGSGLINVFNAIHATTLVSPGELILNDTAHFKGVHRFTVSNKGASRKSYTLNHVPAGTAVTITPDTIFPAIGPVPLSSDVATIQFSRSSFTLAPGKSITIIATFTPPAGGDPATLPVYSGFIQVVSGSEITHVTYQGLKGSLYDAQVIDDTDYFFGFDLPAVLDEFGNPQIEPTNYTFVGNSWPALLLRLAFGTPSLRVDLVYPNTTVVPTYDRRDLTIPDERTRGSSFAKVPIVGTLNEFAYLPRSDEVDFANPYYIFEYLEPVFADGTTIPNGEYKILVRALKVTGNRNKQSDYETWLSPIVGVDVAP